MDIPCNNNSSTNPKTRHGKRRLSVEMLSAREELLTPPIHFPSRRDLLNMLNSLRGNLPVSRSAANTLIMLVEKTRISDWEEPGTPFIYAHNSTIMSWTGLSRSTLQRHIRELAEARLLVPQDGRNGQRGHRWQGTDIQEAVGFNLSSLRYRWNELLSISTERRHYREHIASIRQSIASLNDSIRSIAEALSLEMLILKSIKIMRNRLRTENLDRLENLYQEMKVLYHEVKNAEQTVIPDKILVDNQLSSSKNPSKTEPMGAQIEAHHTNTENNKNTKIVVNVAASNSNHIEAVQDEYPLPLVEPIRFKGRSAMRGFKATSLFFLEICPVLRDICRNTRPSSTELVEAAEYLSSRIGISYHAWGQGCQILGRYQAAISIIIMAARLENGTEIRHRDAYFRALIERGAQNKLFLDRSLYALRDARNRKINQANP